MKQEDAHIVARRILLGLESGEREQDLWRIPQIAAMPADEIREVLSIAYGLASESGIEKITDLAFEITFSFRDWQGLIDRSAPWYPEMTRLIETGAKIDNSTLARVAHDAGSFVAIDCETNGLSPDCHSIIRLDWAVFSNGQPVEQRSVICNPGVKLDKFTSKLVSIDNDVLMTSESFKDGAKALLKKVESHIVVCHNADFVLSFINEECKRAGLFFRPAFVTCTRILVIARSDSFPSDPTTS